MTMITILRPMPWAYQLLTNVHILANQTSLQSLIPSVSFLLLTSTKMYLSFFKQPPFLLRGYVIVGSTIQAPYCSHNARHPRCVL